MLVVLKIIDYEIWLINQVVNGELKFLTKSPQECNFQSFSSSKCSNTK